MIQFRKILKSFGPGFITGASDDDPSGIATYSQAGALFGYSQVWVSLFSFPLMTSVQEMCGRIGMVTGKGLAGVMKAHYSKIILYSMVFLLFAANTINIGADLGAMAASLHLIVPLHQTVLLLMIVLITILLQVFVTYKTYARYLKFLTFALFAYIICAFIVKVDWKEVFFSLTIPRISFDKIFLQNIVALFGTTISPYLFFWQASEEVEEEVAHNKITQMGRGIPFITKKDIRSLQIDTTIGMFFSNLVMFFIIVTTGATLYPAGISPITSAEQAASALQPLAGDFAFVLFAMGIVGTGFLAIPVLAGSSSYAISETFGWKEGLYRKLNRAKGFYYTIIGAVLVGFFLNFLSFNPIDALYYSAVLNGCVAPVLLCMILFIANNKNIMRDHTNGVKSNVLGITTFLVMCGASLGLFISMLV